MRVEDSGGGFDLAAARGCERYSEQLHGRGLKLISQLAEKSDWESDGRGVSVEFSWSAQA